MIEWLEERRRLYTIYHLRGYSKEIASEMSLHEIEKRRDEGEE